MPRTRFPLLAALLLATLPLTPAAFARPDPGVHEIRSAAPSPEAEFAAEMRDLRREIVRRAATAAIASAPDEVQEMRDLRALDRTAPAPAAPGAD